MQDVCSVAGRKSAACALGAPSLARDRQWRVRRFCTSGTWGHHASPQHPTAGALMGRCAAALSVSAPHSSSRRLPAVTFSGNNASALATLLDTELLSWGSFRCPLCALPLHPLPTVGLAPSPKPRGFSQGSRAFLKVHLFVCSFSSSVLAEDGLWCSASGSGATTDTNQTQACL